METKQTTTETEINPGDLVDYQDCKWRVMWSQDGEIGIQSVGGIEAIKVLASDVVA